jgi:hypothetical protein
VAPHSRAQEGAAAEMAWSLKRFGGEMETWSVAGGEARRRGL